MTHWLAKFDINADPDHKLLSAPRRLVRVYLVNSLRHVRRATGDRNANCYAFCRGALDPERKEGVVSVIVLPVACRKYRENFVAHEAVHAVQYLCRYAKRKRGTDDPTHWNVDEELMATFVGRITGVVLKAIAKFERKRKVR